MDLHFFFGRILRQVLADVDGSEAERPRPEPIQNGPVEESPEAALDLRRAEPAAVLAVRPGSDQRREIAVLGPLPHFMLEPARVQARELGVG